MARFRSKPVEIEAVQFSHPMAKSATPVWLKDEIEAGNVWFQGGDVPYLTLKTANGEVRAEIGDWIIREPSGVGAYPCRPSVFAAKYEPID